MLRKIPQSWLGGEKKGVGGLELSNPSFTILPRLVTQKQRTFCVETGSQTLLILGGLSSDAPQLEMDLHSNKNRHKWENTVS